MTLTDVDHVRRAPRGSMGNCWKAIELYLLSFLHLHELFATMSMPASTANWHWKNKNVSRWAKDWFERELVTASVSGEGQEVVKVVAVTEVDGDVELGQRKSKYAYWRM